MRVIIGTANIWSQTKEEKMSKERKVSELDKIMPSNHPGHKDPR